MGALKAGCERAREWVSLALDGELSELEAARLRAHTERCAACAAYARTVRAATEELRAAEPEPAAVVVPLDRSRRRRPLLHAMLPAAAVIALATATGLSGSLPPAASAHAKAPYFEQRLEKLARHTHGGVIITS
jgi:anti-sigma factor RsiW